MPLYDYNCDSCGRHKGVVKPIREHTRTIKCVCGAEMAQELGFAHVIPDIEPYKSMVTGERIKGRSHHKKHLKEHGLVEVGNERLPERKMVSMPPVHEDIKRSIQELRSK